MVSVIVHGVLCTLNKYRWNCADAEVEEFLNDVTEMFPPAQRDPDPERTIFQLVEEMALIDDVIEFQPEFLGEDVDLWAFPNKTGDQREFTRESTHNIPEDWVPEDASN